MQDPLSTEINKLGEDEITVSTWMVFAATVLLDVHEILGP